MIKQIWKYFTFAIGWGSFLMAINIVLMHLTNADGLQTFFDNPIAFVIGHLIIGVGFFGTAIIYEIERISFRLKLVIHVVVGIGLLLLVSSILDWGIIENSTVLFFNIALSIGIIFVAWIVLYLRDKREVKEINKTLKNKNHEKPLDTE